MKPIPTGFRHVAVPDYWRTLRQPPAPVTEPRCKHCGDDGLIYAHVRDARGLDGAIHEIWETIPCPYCRDICPTCANRGAVVVNGGEMVPCPANCLAAQERRREHEQRLFASSKLAREYRALTFNTFRDRCDQDGSWAGKELGFLGTMAFAEAEAPDLAVDYQFIAQEYNASALPDWRNWLVLWGKHGVGKTGLAAAVVNRLVERGITVRYCRAQAVLKAVKDRYEEDWQDNPPDDDFGDVASGAVIDLVSKAPVLVLDEFDVPQLTDWARGVMENIIRYRHGEILPTIITTNLDERQMDSRWGPTTVSVIRQRAHWLEMKGNSLRPTPQHAEAE